MSWQDRDYSHSNYGQGPGQTMMPGFAWPGITPVVKILLIVNIAVFVAKAIFGPKFTAFWDFTVPQAVSGGQIWRFVTYQYLHGSVGHIFFNMVGLYFLGNLMERRWGGRKFFLLYTLFGVAGALLYTLTVAVNLFPPIPMIGASGSVLGLVGACAVAAPHVKVLLFFLFPVSIRTVAIIFGAVYLLSVMSSENGADACHLGGLAVGALWVWLEGKSLIPFSGASGRTIGHSGRKWVQVKVRKGAWERKLKRKQAHQAEIDRILRKIHEKGLASLSSYEKKLLQKASRNQTDYGNE